MICIVLRYNNKTIMSTSYSQGDNILVCVLFNCKKMSFILILVTRTILFYKHCISTIFLSTVFILILSYCTKRQKRTNDIILLIARRNIFNNLFFLQYFHEENLTLLDYFFNFT